jgi:hypothetical protein
MFGRIPVIVSKTNRTFVKNAGIVSVMDRIVGLTTDRTSATIPSTGQRTESMTDVIDVSG